MEMSPVEFRRAAQSVIDKAKHLLMVADQPPYPWWATEELRHQLAIASDALVAAHDQVADV